MTFDEFQVFVGFVFLIYAGTLIATVLVRILARFLAQRLALSAELTQAPGSAGVGSAVVTMTAIPATEDRGDVEVTAAPASEESGPVSGDTRPLASRRSDAPCDDPASSVAIAEFGR